MNPSRHRTSKNPFDGETLRGADRFIMGKTRPIRAAQQVFDQHRVEIGTTHADKTGPGKCVLMTSIARATITPIDPSGHAHDSHSRNLTRFHR